MEKRSRIFSKTNSLTKTPWPWRTSSGELNYTSVGGSGNSVRPVVGPRWRLPIVIKISSLDSTTSGPEISLTGTRLSGRGRGWAGGGGGKGSLLNLVWVAEGRSGKATDWFILAGSRPSVSATNGVQSVGWMGPPAATRMAPAGGPWSALSFSLTFSQDSAQNVW